MGQVHHLAPHANSLEALASLAALLSSKGIASQLKELAESAAELKAAHSDLSAREQAVATKEGQLDARHQAAAKREAEASEQMAKAKAGYAAAAEHDKAQRAAHSARETELTAKAAAQGEKQAELDDREAQLTRREEILVQELRITKELQATLQAKLDSIRSLAA